MARMKKVKIDPQQLAQAIDPHTKSVIDVLSSFRIPTRIVGGAVRDILQNRRPRDIDLVADADPTVLIYIFEGHDWPLDLGGIAHGTVKVIFGHGSTEQKIDVSSLGYRIQRHGQRVRGSGTHSWAVDSGLRDLTINSMSMTLDGVVYDYQGGLHDLKRQVVRMGPHAEDSYVLDPNDIMRYFKSVAQFEKPRLVKDDLTWIAQHVWRLADSADDQRVQMNWISIQKGVNRKATIDLMCEMGVNKYLPFVTCNS